MIPHPIRTLDLFAGAGGITEGFKQASDLFRCVRAVEWDADASRTFDANHGGGEAVTFAGDIETWTEHEAVPDADVVVGGPPCQGFSQLGKQQADDERNALWRHYAEAVRDSGATYFVMENVPQFAKSLEAPLFFREFEPGGILENYRFDTDVLDASHFGAAQKRKRFIALGWKKGAVAPKWPTKLQENDRKTLADVLAGVPSRVTSTHLRPERPVQTHELHFTRDYRDISLKRFRDIPPGGNRFDIRDEYLAPCWRNHKSGSGDVMGRLYWDRPSVTIRTEFFKPEKGRYLHPDEHRAITHFEAALIQGFPPNYLWYGSKTSIGKQIGNAVPIPLSKAIAETLLDAFGGIRRLEDAMPLPGME
ncbi:DNA cytosine methyltransferase [Corynebacterium sp. NPDC060344]|uniref:DNA cytosine methyltransferase n=1 Tax=Corynebacterium sp. NPDC060344 TaxID=3347101 RepID=UPI003656E3FF